MSTPFDREDQQRDDLGRDDERDDFAPRISEDEQGIDALLRAGGEQWRATVPVVEFDRPSSRVATLARGPRILLSLGIAAAVVAIVLAGSALVGRPAAVAPQAPTGSSSAVPTPTNSASGSGTSRSSLPALTPRPLVPPPPTGAPADVSALTEEQRQGHRTGTDVDLSPAARGWGATAFPPVDSSVWAGWNVATGQLLVAIKDPTCRSTPGSLRMGAAHRLDVQLETATVAGPADCPGDRWTSASYTVPSGFDPWIPSTLVTPLGTTDLESSGVVQNPADDKYRDAESITARQIRGSGDAGISVRWVTSSSTLLIDAPAQCATSIVGLASDDRGANLRVLGAPESCADGSSGGSTVSVAVTTPPRSEKAFTLEVAGRTFSIPAALLPRGVSAVVDTDIRWVTMPATVGKTLLVSRVGRTVDGRVIIERPCPAARTSSFRGVQPYQTADQTVVLRQGGQREGCTNPGPGDAAIGSTYVLQPNTDPTKPLSIVFGDNAVELPAMN